MYVLVEKVQSTAFPSIAWLKNDQSRHILANEKLLACVLNATEKWIYRLRTSNDRLTLRKIIIFVRSLMFFKFIEYS